MAQITTGMFTVSLLDYSDEKIQTSFYIPEITDTNYTASMTAVGALQTAFDDLTIGAVNQTEVASKRVTEDPKILPANSYAQRELRWQVVYQDTVTLSKHTFMIGCADTTDNLVVNTDKADLSSTDWAAFKTAFEALATSPAGNAVVLLDASLIGRNS